MAENLVLDVNINPYGQPPVTATNLNLPNAMQPSFLDKQISARNAIAIGVLASSGSKLVNQSVGRVGDWTGNNQFQKVINVIGETSSLFAEGFVGFQTAGIVGAIAVPTISLVSKTINYSFERRDKNAKADYLRRNRGNRYNESRIRRD